MSKAKTFDQAKRDKLQDSIATAREVAARVRAMTDAFDDKLAAMQAALAKDDVAALWRAVVAMQEEVFAHNEPGARPDGMESFDLPYDRVVYWLFKLDPRAASVAAALDALDYEEGEKPSDPDKLGRGGRMTAEA